MRQTDAQVNAKARTEPGPRILKALISRLYNNSKGNNVIYIMKLVFATNNQHKLAEARQLAGDGIEILSLSDIDCHEELPETCDTIEGNSRQKAEYVYRKYGYPCFSDDTGLFVDALDGAPGVYSARYAGPGCNPEDNIRKMLEEMEGKQDRDARFRTVVTLCSPQNSDDRSGEPVVHQFEGKVEGRIATEKSGNAGFGYDPIFIPVESGISFADMTAEDKNAISHRGRALKKLFEYLSDKS